MGMMWFIFSEVMFFAAFFGALFYARMLSVPWLGGEGVKVFTNFILWPHFEAAWPTNGPAHVGGIDGVFEHHPGDRHPDAQHRDPADQRRSPSPSPTTRCVPGKRGKLKLFLALTFLLGFTFVGFQAHEYGEAYKELGLRLSTGIYGSTFFMLTGFHGLHVTIGAIMLTVIWLRVLHGALHPQAPLRLRGGGLVLALRRRGVARPVHLRVLAVDARRAARALGVRRLADGQRVRERGTPARQATNSSTNSASDRLMRMVRARASLRESSSPPPRERWNSAEPRLTTNPGKAQRNQDPDDATACPRVYRLRARGRCAARAWGLARAGACSPALAVRAPGVLAVGRGQVREAQWDAFAAAPSAGRPGHGATADIALYQRVRANGTLDAQHQFLLDNRSYRGRPGYEVLTPLVRTGASDAAGGPRLGALHRLAPRAAGCRRGGSTGR